MNDLELRREYRTVNYLVSTLANVCAALPNQIIDALTGLLWDEEEAGLIKGANMPESAKETRRMPAVEGRLDREVRPHCSHCSHCRFPLSASDSGLRHYGTHTAHQESECLRLLHAEIARLTACLKAANDQAEHFERNWYLAKEDADRCGAELDQALDDAMVEDADARNEAGYAA